MGVEFSRGSSLNVFFLFPSFLFFLVGLIRDFVGGFHKRKKKRRKEAQQKLQESQRIKRIVARKKVEILTPILLFTCRFSFGLLLRVSL